MSVSRKDVLRIAALAELEVDDTSAAELEGQLSRILDYVAQLGELKEAPQPAADERVVRLRPDQLGGAEALERLPAQWAPAFTGGLFTVPRLGERERGEDE